MPIRKRIHPAEVLAALGHPVRLEIVVILSGGERCVAEIVPYFSRERSVVSRHLAVLEGAGVVCSRRQGRKVFYSIADQRVLSLLDVVLDVAMHPEKARPGPGAVAMRGGEEGNG